MIEERPRSLRLSHEMTAHSKLQEGIRQAEKDINEIEAELNETRSMADKRRADLASLRALREQLPHQDMETTPLTPELERETEREIQALDELAGYTEERLTWHQQYVEKLKAQQARLLAAIPEDKKN